ncbi:MAG TPA: alpha/beta hydrolase [Pseudomonadales bacterium]
MTSRLRKVTAVVVLLLWHGTLEAAEAAESSVDPSDEVVPIWPGEPPGTSHWVLPETVESQHVPAAGRVVQLIRNVTVPTLTVVRPKPALATGAGVIVLPGGGFGALAWDLEGTEVAHWLAERGVTAFVLKYRIQDPDPALQPKITEVLSRPPAERFQGFMEVIEPRRRIAVADAMQAIRVVRSAASTYGVSADRIGIMGFSAGAITTMGAALEGQGDARPSFAVPVYGAMAAGGKPSADAPPLFIVVAADDDTVAAEQSIAVFQAWQAAGVPAELHVYETGGHGFGLGKPGTASAHWPAAFQAWLARRGLVAGSGPEGGQ